MENTKANALYTVEQSGKEGTQSFEIRRFLERAFPDNYTRQEISKALDMPINVVCARVNAMVKRNILVPGFIRPCNVSGQRVTTVRANLPMYQDAIVSQPPFGI